MRVILVSWRNPVGDLMQEQFDSSKFKVFTEPGWLKLKSEETGHIVRLIPSTHVRLVEFGETKEKPRILTPQDAELVGAGLTS